MEILRLMGILLLIILAIVIGSKVMYKDNFAVITGTITTPEAGSGTLNGSTVLAYPSGFTKDNAIIISLMVDNTATTNEYFATTGGTGKSVENMRSNYGLQARFKNDGIYVETHKIDASAGSTTNTIKVVLMKI